ncbi:MAG TPA: YbaN family protein [Xanthobacteraceae bacterium]|nr:YbaN family protein [Xanthobacteraceae bacterium]
MDPQTDTPLLHPVLRWLMLGLAWICVALGFIGLVMPMMPGTVFFIAAAWLFSRTSPRFETWLLDHPRLGPTVRAWRHRGAIARPMQIFASASMVGSFGLLVLMGAALPVLLVCGAAFVGVAAFLLTRPTE